MTNAMNRMRIVPQPETGRTRLEVVAPTEDKVLATYRPDAQQLRAMIVALAGQLRLLEGGKPTGDTPFLPGNRYPQVLTDLRYYVDREALTGDPMISFEILPGMWWTFRIPRHEASNMIRGLVGILAQPEPAPETATVQ